MATAFESDLAADLRNPDFARVFAAEQVRIATIDELVVALDDERARQHLSKAALARAVGAEPSVVRRLFSAATRNPTLGTFVDLAAALGLRLTLEPMTDDERPNAVAGAR